MTPPSAAKILMTTGTLLFLAGFATWGLSALGLKLPALGRLPGDLSIDTPQFKFYFPLTTCLLISGLIQLLMRLWSWIFQK